MKIRILIAELPQDWGKQRLLEGTNKILYALGPRGKDSDPTRDRVRIACECIGVSG